MQRLAVGEAVLGGEPGELEIVEEEADERMYWLELLVEIGILPAAKLSELIDELNQIVAMVVASQKTLRANNPKSKI